MSKVILNVGDRVWRASTGDAEVPIVWMVAEVWAVSTIGEVYVRGEGWGTSSRLTPGGGWRQTKAEALEHLEALIRERRADALEDLEECDRHLEWVARGREAMK